MLLSSSANFFKINFFKNFFQEHYQSVKQFGTRSGPSVGPDLGPNCLQKLSADVKSKGHNVMCHNKLACNDCMMSFHYSPCSGRCDWEESD